MLRLDRLFKLGLALSCAAASPVSPEVARVTCVPVRSIGYDDDPAPGDVCTVVALTPIPGSASPRLYWQSQAFVTQPGGEKDGAGSAVLAAERDGRLRLLDGVAGQDAVFEPPRLVGTPQGQVLVIPATAAVSSVPDLTLAMRRIGGRWTVVSDGWSKAVAARLPPGVAQWKGGTMDWPRLQASSALWREGDANCCPTGGSYRARLRFDGTRLSLVSLTVSKDGLPE